MISVRPDLARMVRVFLLAVLASALPALAQQQITFPNFASTTGLTCNGSALSGGVCQTSGTALELTSASPGQDSSVWFSAPNAAGTIPLANGFTTNFQMRFTPSGQPADGVAFVIQPPNASALLKLADGGGSVGYGDSDIPTDPNGFASLAVEFDTYLNSDNGDAYIPHVAVQSCGGSASNTPNHANCNFGVSAFGAVPFLSDGAVHTVTINYVVTTATPTLSVFVDGNQVLSSSITIPSVLGLDATGDAVVGFTSATGAAFEEHDILNWNLSIANTQPAPVTSTTPVATTTFNDAPDNVVSHKVDFTAGFQGNTLVGTDNHPTLTSSNKAVAPGDWVKFVAGTPFATTSCVLHNGEGGNCKLFTDLCTNDDSSTPSGQNCPQSSVRNIAIEDDFDATPKPSTATGTGFGLLMGGDDWSALGAASCVFAGTEAGLPCPENILTSFTGDGSVSGGATKGLNSTFITVSGVLMPKTAVTVSPTNNNGWTNSATPSVTFTSSPPGTLGGVAIPAVPPSSNSNNFVAAPIAGITYGVNGQPIPSTILAGACPAAIIPGTTVANPFSSAVSLPTLNQGLNTLAYSANDCAGTEELVFTFTGSPSTGSWSTLTKSVPIYVDSTPPVAGCPAADTIWHGGNVTVTCAASDSQSGFAPPTSTVNGTSFGALTGSINLSTATSGPVEVTNAVTNSTSITDLAGNGPVAVGPVGPFKIDTKAPVITALAPPPSSIQSYFFNQTAKIAATYKCLDNGSGVVNCGATHYATPVQGTTATMSSNVNTSVLGQSQSFSISAKDAVGNTGVATLFTYNVSYLFIGFVSLQAPPLTNVLKAGKATAILFAVEDGRPQPVSGLKLSPAGAVTVAASTSTNCSGTGATPVAFNGTLSGLPLGIYSLNWTPPTALANKCVTLMVGLGDGVTHKVNLKF